ncbi:head-tail connector protein [Roseovarius pacificus]|uniref:hypothetical protein n=1 Tax=Roseovarius pacificus TaxID=337701 RepID=UPI0040390CD4
MLTLLTQSADYPVSKDDLCEAIKVSHDDDNFVLLGLIASETQRYEAFTGRVMRLCTYELKLDRLMDPITLPVTPVREVTKFAYLDADNVEQTIASSDWYMRPGIAGTDIWFSKGFSVPTLSSQALPVSITFSAGYFTPGEDITNPALAPMATDQRNIIALIQRIYDEDKPMTEAEMREIMGHRRVFR